MVTNNNDEKGSERAGPVKGDFIAPHDGAERDERTDALLAQEEF